MKNNQLINYLHSIYPELPINIHKIKGYSDDEIKKIERLYDIKVADQLYDFLNCMGRCSGGFFGMILWFFTENGLYDGIFCFNMVQGKSYIILVYGIC
ncbi:hypothetical protein [Proteus hauseri]|uniref:hypothetical protein n=1 Tax=Proteus hauseri TaxID=183417 RepID=UPI0010093E28|nr:hypothetical protein [Proteus hauseri]QAV24080.1 hypothetical protein PH4a_12350 [Proteus hauseri]